MIKPTVGRVVWARLTPTALQPGDQPYAAIVVSVHNDRLVNLAIFDHCGGMKPMERVPLVQDGDPPYHGGMYCEWMPYQKGQAAKTEALEAAQR